MFGIFKKLPKLFALLATFIVIFLLGFLLMGCMDTSSTFSDIYLIKLGFNESSDLFSEIEQAYKETNSSSELSKLLIQASYLAMCANLNGVTSCAPTTNMQSLSKYSGISIIETEHSTSSQINLVTVAKAFSDGCYPRILMATIVLAVLLMLLLVWTSIPLLPAKPMVKRIACFLLACSVLTWGLGAMLQHEAVVSLRHIIGPASMYTLQVQIGQRAEAVTWTAFAFFLATFASVTLQVVRDLLLARKQNVVKF